MSLFSDECAMCEAPAEGEAEIVDTDDGERYILRLCAECGKAFQVPEGTVMEIEQSIVGKPVLSPERMN